MKIESKKINSNELKKMSFRIIIKVNVFFLWCVVKNAIAPKSNVYIRNWDKKVK